MIDYSHGEYRHCASVTSMPLLTTGRGEATGTAASAGRRECTGTAANIQQCWLPGQIRCALGNLARASLSVMQAGEPKASDGPRMIATARIRILSPATQLRAGELIPPDQAGGSSGATLQVALVSVHRGAVAPSFRAQAGALVWAPVGARCWARSRRRFDHQPAQDVRYCRGERKGGGRIVVFSRWTPEWDAFTVVSF
jgi:hypothetical protein